MIRLQDITVKFGDFTALDQINVQVKEGEFFTFLGPSGCGKTTTLRVIAGFIQPVSGRVYVRGEDITPVPIEERNIGIVFQSYALFPTMTVRDNSGHQTAKRLVHIADLQYQSAHGSAFLRAPSHPSRTERSPPGRKSTMHRIIIPMVSGQ